MAENFVKLYAVDSPADTAFFLNEGKIYFYASNADKYALSGKNLIVGSTEIIINKVLGLDTGRIETAVAEKSSSIKRMSVDKVIEGLMNYSISMNISIVLAKQVLLSNRIIDANINLLEGNEKKIRELAVEHFTIVEGIREEYDKRKMPWLKELLKTHETSLTYKRGEAYYRSSEPVKITATKNLSDRMVEYERGAVICEENSTGNEMYILESGAIDVIISGNKVTSIDDPGTVIGEMALLLGEKRTATLKAKNNVVVTRIGKEDLKDIADKQHEVLQGIALALAKKHYYNIMKIGSINRSLVEHSLNQQGDQKQSQLEKVRKELSILKDDVRKRANEKEADFLQDLVPDND